MTTVREQPVVRPSTSPAQRLRATMAAARVAFCWFGVRRPVHRSRRLKPRRMTR